MSIFEKQFIGRPLYHIYPEKGLLNDPNGLVYFNNQYHVFFQLNPTGLTHKNKHWGHIVSDDLLHWKRLPIALSPTEWYDKDGCYSGSAVVKDDTLYLFYTGNVINEGNSRSSYQCLATSADGVTFEKKGPIFPHPKGFTRHVRDPKVWRGKNGKWWLVLGAQSKDLRGTSLLYSSNNLVTWEEHGELIKESLDLGYMWECPDIVQLNGRDCFIFSPQGYDTGKAEQNLYPTGYFLGTFDEENKKFIPSSEFQEVDQGFEFYAPQTFQDKLNQTILFGWMGIMEEDKEQKLAEISKDWIHQLTLPRQLIIDNNQLIQKPVSTLKQLRGNKKVIDLSNKQMFHFDQFENEVIFSFWEQNTDIHLQLFNALEIQWTAEIKELTVRRLSWVDDSWEQRKAFLHDGLKHIRMFTEKSSVEIFVNEGLTVFSQRLSESHVLPTIEILLGKEDIKEGYYYPIINFSKNPI